MITFLLLWYTFGLFLVVWAYKTNGTPFMAPDFIMSLFVAFFAPAIFILSFLGMFRE